MYPEVETQRESWFPVPQKGRPNDLSQNDEALSNHRRTRANADKMCRNAAASNWRPCLRARSRARCIKTCNSKAVQARGGPEGPCALCIAAPRDARVAPHVRSSARQAGDAHGSKQKSEAALLQGHGAAVARCVRWMSAPFCLDSSLHDNERWLELGNTDTAIRQIRRLPQAQRVADLTSHVAGGCFGPGNHDPSYAA